jgi:succinate dehydrogenase/fumarate reductase flavoprotein subunit
VQIHGKTVALYMCNTVVIGSGASAFCAANRLWEFGQEDILMLTEGLTSGTSRNTGSDKQTYYKLTMCGESPDSVEDMAKTYYGGGCMDGDIALCEAAYSARSFYYLCEAGVPFPQNHYGEFPGYQTDHDRHLRATSAGPLTSRMMTERLEERAKRAGIPILDRYRVVSLLVKDGKCLGVLALSKKDGSYLIVNATNVIYATGGPAGIYAESVYPASQSGGTGIALEAGVLAKNITEWQYGLASIGFRWNLSGSYQQVLPRYISTDQQMGDEREFLEDYFADSRKLLDNIFLKGYQWPFDPRKVAGDGSSMIDILVYREKMEKNRRVFLDFTHNPRSLGEVADFSKLGEESYRYLKNSGALFGSPIERLEHMNPKAIQLYKDHGIDLHDNYLEISVCAQHNNGGLSGNHFWESNISHLFPIGEVNGTHGIYRPGGSALNAGQVGALRAAQYITRHYGENPPDSSVFMESVSTQIGETMDFGDRYLKRTGSGVQVGLLRKRLGSIISRYCAYIRSKEHVVAAKRELDVLANMFEEDVVLRNKHELPAVFRMKDHLLVARVLIEAIDDYIEHGGGSRGSYIILNDEGNDRTEGVSDLSGMIQQLSYDDGVIKAQWRSVRPIPNRDLWFEHILKEAQNHDNY